MTPAEELEAAATVLRDRGREGLAESADDLALAEWLDTEARLLHRIQRVVGGMRTAPAEGSITPLRALTVARTINGTRPTKGPRP